MKPNALLFLPYLAPYRIDVLNELGKYYNLTVIFQFDNAPEQNFDQPELRKMLTVNFQIFESGFNIGTRQFRYGVYKLITKYKPQIVFSNEYGPTSLLLSFYKKIKLFDYIHIATTSDNVIIASTTKRLRRIARRIVLSSTSGVVVYNNEVKNWYESHFPEQIIKVCPNIQNPKSFEKHTAKIEEIKKQYEQDYNLKNKAVVLFVGRLHQVKGIDSLIKVFLSLNRKDIQLIIVGDGPQKDDLFNLVKTTDLSNPITFVGRAESSALYAWYSLASFLVLPSIHEPFGAVVNEALILGLPVMCSIYAGASFYISDDNNGFLFDPKDMIDFKAKINLALDNFKKTSPKNNLMLYDFETSVYQYFAMYAELKSRKHQLNSHNYTV